MDRAFAENRYYVSNRTSVALANCPRVTNMARKRLPQQQDLLSAVWTLSCTREDVERLLAHIVQVQSEAIALAAAYGAKQSELATLTDLSRQRVGQIVDQVDITDLRPSEISRRSHSISEWPSDTMSALATLAHPADVDDVERRERERRKTAVVYGQEEADRRHNARSAFLASLATDSERRAEIVQLLKRAQRRLSGAD